MRIRALGEGQTSREVGAQSLGASQVWEVAKLISGASRTRVEKSTDCFPQGASGVPACDRSGHLCCWYDAASGSSPPYGWSVRDRLLFPARSTRMRMQAHISTNTQ
jgi:hypothetical protein